MSKGDGNWTYYDVSQSRMMLDIEIAMLLIHKILSLAWTDCGSFSEHSDTDLYEVNSPFSSSSSSSKEEEVVQSEPDRGRKRTRKALPKRANTHFELGWKKQIQMVQTPAFAREPGINKNFHITQGGSHWHIFETFFCPKMFKLIQKQTNCYATQQINKKEQDGPLKPKFIFARCNTVSL